MVNEVLANTAGAFFSANFKVWGDHISSWMLGLKYQSRVFPMWKHLLFYRHFGIDGRKLSRQITWTEPRKNNVFERMDGQ